MGARNLSVLLVEDSRVLAERLRETLLSVPGVQLAGTVDSEADALIGEMFNRYPEARYRLTQLAFVQEHALAEASNRS